MADVEYRHVEKVFEEGTKALDDFSLAVEDGEMMVLVGPSGCGKSTALRLLAGLEATNNGELLIGGRLVNECLPQHRDIAMVFQNYALYPHMTVRRNLEFPLRMMKLSKSEMARRVEDTARLLTLTELLEKRPRQLSGGQRQRVAMGRAMVRQPQVFLMDEPLSNLDAKLRTQIRAEITRLQKSSGVTTIYVTHDQVEAMTLGDRIAVLNAGKLQQVGPPQELYEHPANTFVAEFLGNPGMNIFDATLNRDTGIVQLAAGAWRIPVEPLLARTPSLMEYLDRPLLAGLRPERFSVSASGPEASVESVESLGHECLVYFTPSCVVSGKDPKTLVARLPGQALHETEQSIHLGFDPQRLHFFTAEGDAIAL
ncbi:MAG: sn-glycerol-3-phosphate ABC transporter ATP-binding protein UgpC [Candidatus Thiodiazotropha taylori]|nr:sn-glycerol-3-phosphate ABC transporter ATP-binding protein UgpC [Shewanella sp.]MCG7923905.1 sn-glycerol-3-phosphate ABC transporter ATP-binding protein UgpC [Candidatus Thiodiazotropha taylori]MCG7933881.1 sn-glycerol-3-phosphate ABC transporter ATP-binding protein UgpC [Candidatus Thiodiazotropha taylori]MCG7972686.1 sn-glycerol-3-phosphate ABC transporter ATP-binding protein UgpC [Candidatus Thiodiazotropha taylori]